MAHQQPDLTALLVLHLLFLDPPSPCLNPPLWGPLEDDPIRQLSCLAKRLSCDQLRPTGRPTLAGWTQQFSKVIFAFKKTNLTLSLWCSPHLKQRIKFEPKREISCLTAGRHDLFDKAPKGSLSHFLFASFPLGFDLTVWFP